MNKIAELKTQLEDRLVALLNRVDDIEDDLRHPLDADSEEQAVDLSDDEALEGVDSILREEIAQVRAALARIENGTYGKCAVCGEPISHARLQARPIATRCIDHA